MSDELSEADIAQMGAVWDAWQQARQDKDWTRADRLRAYLQRAGCVGDNLERWHPVFETSAHRSRRLQSSSSRSSLSATPFSPLRS